jgi:hypothetical protein
MSVSALLAQRSDHSLAGMCGRAGRRTRRATPGRLWEPATVVPHDRLVVTLRVTIGYDDGVICIDVVDDGRTRRSDLPQRGGRHGLIGMRGGWPCMADRSRPDPLPERGYRVTATLPLPREDP